MTTVYPVRWANQVNPDRLVAQDPKGSKECEDLRDRRGTPDNQAKLAVV